MEIFAVFSEPTYTIILRSVERTVDEFAIGYYSAHQFSNTTEYEFRCVGKLENLGQFAKELSNSYDKAVSERRGPIALIMSPRNFIISQVSLVAGTSKNFRKFQDLISLGRLMKVYGFLSSTQQNVISQKSRENGTRAPSLSSESLLHFLSGSYLGSNFSLPSSRITPRTHPHHYRTSFFSQNFSLSKDIKVPIHNMQIQTW